MKKPHIAIIYNFNDNIENFKGGSKSGIKSKISYFEQFLISFESIKSNWNTEKFTYEFYIIHTDDFSKENETILNSINVKTIKVKNPLGDTGLRCMTFKVKIDCDYRLVLDNDTIGLETPNFDFSKDILVSYGGGVYSHEIYKKFCDYINLKEPIQRPIENMVQRFGSAEYESYYNSNGKTKLFPALNAGALLIRNSLCNVFSEKLMYATRKIPRFARIHGGRPQIVIQPIYGLVVNDITSNWTHFEKGFNLLLSNFKSIKKIYERYKGPIYLAHYINYSEDSDPLNLNIKRRHNKVIKKYKIEKNTDNNKIYLDGRNVRFQTAFKKYKSIVGLDKNSVNLDFIELLQNRLNNYQNFSLMRFNDGEWSYAFGNTEYIESKKGRDNKKLIESAKILKKIIQNNSKYFISVDSFSRKNKNLKKIVNDNLKYIKNLIGGGVFNIWSLVFGFDELFKILNDRKTLLVGPDFLSSLPFEKEHIITHSNQSNYNLEETKNKVIEYLIKNFEENMIIVYSCSFSAKYTLDEVYKKYGETLTQLDMGASLNPYVSFSNRPWFHQQILQLKKENYFNLNNIEFKEKKQNLFK